MNTAALDSANDVQLLYQLAAIVSDVDCSFPGARTDFAPEPLGHQI